MIKIVHKTLSSWGVTMYELFLGVKVMFLSMILNFKLLHKNAALNLKPLEKIVPSTSFS